MGLVAMAKENPEAWTAIIIFCIYSVKPIQRNSSERIMKMCSLPRSLFTMQCTDFRADHFMVNFSHADPMQVGPKID